MCHESRTGDTELVHGEYWEEVELREYGTLMSVVDEAGPYTGQTVCS